jgi:hypothetical protein
MQRLTAVRLRDNLRICNFSGMGSGKTLSAILASRVCESRMTIIVCPNQTVAGWATEIRAAFPDCVVKTKTWEPHWSDGRLHRYLVLNHEMLQGPEAEHHIESLLSTSPVDLVVIDELHMVKNRTARMESRRRLNLKLLLSLAEAATADLRVLGMSGTPVINNLREGRSLLELVTGTDRSDLSVKASVSACVGLHRALVPVSLRWTPVYEAVLQAEVVEIDCASRVPDVLALGRRATPLDVEKILTEVRLPAIIAALRPRTVVYTHLVEGIATGLESAIRSAGWSVGMYTGEDKSGLASFLSGQTDVLVMSGVGGTGLDGLQRVSDQLIVNVLPWTAAEFDQLQGRLWRQGQESKHVRVVLPVTHADLGGRRWSWCEQKLARIRFKRGLADAAVDGVLPEGVLPSPVQATQALLAWLASLTGRGGTEGDGIAHGT